MTADRDALVAKARETALGFFRERPFFSDAADQDKLTETIADLIASEREDAARVATEREREALAASVRVTTIDGHAKLFVGPYGIATWRYGQCVGGSAVQYATEVMRVLKTAITDRATPPQPAPAPEPDAKTWGVWCVEAGTWTEIGPPGRMGSETWARLAANTLNDRRVPGVTYEARPYEPEGKGNHP